MHNLGKFDLTTLQVLVVLEVVEAGRIVVVGWALALREGGVLRAHALLVRHHVVEVDVREDAVVRHRVVCWGRLVVVQVRESGAIRGTQVEGHVLVSIVNGVALLALEELEHVVLHDWVLSDGAGVGTGGGTRDAVTDGKDILVLVVLQSVAVNVNHALRVTDTRVEQEFVLTRGWIHVGANEVALNGLTGVDVLEYGDLGVAIITDADHLPAEVDLDTALVTLLEGDLICVWETVDVLVGRPVLDLGAGGGGTEKLVLTHQGLVVQRVEIGTFTLVWGSGRVVDVVAATEHPVVPVVTDEAVLVIELMDEDVVAIVALIKFRESIDELARVVKASSENESLVAELLSILQVKLVGVRVKLGHLRDLDLGPVVDHGGKGASLHLESLDVTLEDAEVGLRLHPDGVAGDHSDLQVAGPWVLLNEFGEGTAVRAT